MFSSAGQYISTPACLTHSTKQATSNSELGMEI